MELIATLKTQSTRKYLWILTFSSFLIWSGINPKEYFTWFLEVFPALAALLALVITYNSFRLTTLAYILILLHSIVLMIGGHYTYAEVPFFDYLKEVFDLSRNNYDKLGHFMQGLVPALITREILIRKNAVNGSSFLALFIISFCLAFSAFYELIEWWVAVLVGDNAEAFLGTQGYVWDTQSDMAYALFGAIMSLIIFTNLHDRQLAKLNS